MFRRVQFADCIFCWRSREMISLLIKSVIVASVFAQGIGNSLKTIQKNHRGQQLSNQDLRYLANLSNKNYTNHVLDNILIPRVVGTPNHKKVFEYIKNELESLDWHVEVDEFEDNAPQFGRLTFKNIIASLNPNADRYLVLACHYDSKFFKNEEFVGATDSAVPCAMLLNLAKVMKREFSLHKGNSDVNLKLIFFDGEEAFVNWGPDDSIYGARHLAEVYHNRKVLRNGEAATELEKMDMLVLLDLIGHAGTKFYSHHQETLDWYLRVAEAEDRLQKLDLLERPKKQYFVKRAFYGNIEDDHLPFLRRGVPIMHVISHPFPKEWHTIRDNRDIIDMRTVEDINKILRVFVVEYLNMLVSDQ